MRMVQGAIREEVDAVAIAGDVVDRDNCYAEAFGPLEDGLRQLCEAGIHVVAITGNHDHNVFAAMSDRLSSEHFHFLGMNGRWERFTLERDGRAIGHFDGWSYPDVEARVDPLAGYDLPPPADDAPRLGLLHTALDRMGQVYAPVTRAQLRNHAVTLWLLGHFHVVRLWADDGLPYVLYPGQPQAMQPRESGPHGIWMVETQQAGAKPEMTFMPFSTVRYDAIDVVLDDAASVDEVRGCAIDAVRRHADAIRAGAGSAEILMCRLRFCGRTPLHRDLAGVAEELTRGLEFPCGGMTAAVEKVSVDALPACDVETLAREGGDDPLSAVAQVIVALRDPRSALAKTLLAGARERMRGIDSAAAYAGLLAADSAERYRREQEARDVLVRQAAVLLDELLRQREAST